MLRISHQQFEGFVSAEQGRLKTQTTARLIKEHPAFAEDEEAINAMVAQLIASGFDDQDQLVQAADSLLRIARQQDPEAAQRRAVADRILFENAHAPAARLAFFPGPRPPSQRKRSLGFGRAKLTARFSIHQTFAYWQQDLWPKNTAPHDLVAPHQKMV